MRKTPLSPCQEPTDGWQARGGGLHSGRGAGRTRKTCFSTPTNSLVPNPEKKARRSPGGSEPCGIFSSLLTCPLSPGLTCNRWNVQHTRKALLCSPLRANCAEVLSKVHTRYRDLLPPTKKLWPASSCCRSQHWLANSIFSHCVWRHTHTHTQKVLSTSTTKNSTDRQKLPTLKYRWPTVFSSFETVLFT